MVFSEQMGPLWQWDQRVRQGRSRAALGLGCRKQACTEWLWFQGLSTDHLLNQWHQYPGCRYASVVMFRDSTPAKWWCSWGPKHSSMGRDYGSRFQGTGLCKVGVSLESEAQVCPLRQEHLLLRYGHLWSSCGAGVWITDIPREVGSNGGNTGWPKMAQQQFLLLGHTVCLILWEPVAAVMDVEVPSS